MEILKNIILSAVVIDCCLVFYCKGVALTLGDIPTNVYVQNEQSLDIECILPSGNLDSTVLRNWDKDGVTVVNGGAPVNSGSGYSETLQSDRFILTTPKLNYSFDGTQYKCTYRFSQASVIVKIADIGTTDQSKGDCIDGKSIEKCWFSLSKVLPVITTQSNLTVSYEDDTVENINSALNTTAQLNADGNTWAYYFRIEQNSILKEVKAITLSFEAGPFTRVLTINSIKDCFLDIFLCGFLPDSLIEVIASITIFIILKKECLPKLFGEFTRKKLGIIIAFLVIAIIIGVCLGLLIKGCDKKFLALGLSLFFGILLVVALIFALIYYHKKCESGSDIQDGDGGEDSNRFSLDSCFRKCKVKPEKEIQLQQTGLRSSQNNTGSNTTRTGTGRVGSPASTSNVELAANLNRNKTDVPKGDQSALNQKAWQSPLPLPPVASQPPTASTHNLPLSRNNQLGPIAVENEEANSSEKKKKKKKKKKKRIVDEAEDNENES